MTAAPADDSAAFQAWEDKVRDEVYRLLEFCGLDDLPDVTTRDWFDAGWSPTRAARKAIANAKRAARRGDY